MPEQVIVEWSCFSLAFLRAGWDLFSPA